jgi:hypothetical protein
MIVCERCRIGRCQPQRVPYFYQMGKHLLLVPDAPSLVCDVCELITYDDEYLSHLHQLITQTANPGEEPPVLDQRQLLLASQPYWSRPRRSI